MGTEWLGIGINEILHFRSYTFYLFNGIIGIWRLERGPVRRRGRSWVTKTVRVLASTETLCVGRPSDVNPWRHILNWNCKSLSGSEMDLKKIGSCPSDWRWRCEGFLIGEWPKGWHVQFGTDGHNVRVVSTYFRPKCLWILGTYWAMHLRG